MLSMTLKPVTLELSKKDIITIPYVLKNKILMAPGPWNDVHYSPEEIKKAYQNTDWSNKDTISIIADHQDERLKIGDWLGWVKNPKLIGANLIGDLELWDEDTIIKLVKAKAKFGISPKVRGLESKGEFRNFTFENFSVVTNPAVKKAYINLSQKLKGGRRMEEKELQEETEEESVEETSDEEPEEESEEATEEMAKKPYKYPEKEMKKKKPYKEEMKKKKYPYPEEEEMDDEEMFEVVTNSAWTDFVSKMRKKYPKMSFKDIAAAFKKTKKASEELEELSDEELTEKLEQLVNILRRRKKYEKPEEKEMSETEKKLAQEIRELKERLDEPDIKSVQELSVSSARSIFDKDEQRHTPGVLAMAEFMKNNYLK